MFATKKFPVPLTAGFQTQVLKQYNHRLKPPHLHHHLFYCGFTCYSSCSLIRSGGNNRRDFVSTTFSTDSRRAVQATLRPHCNDGEEYAQCGGALVGTPGEEVAGLTLGLRPFCEESGGSPRVYWVPSMFAQCLLGSPQVLQHFKTCMWGQLGTLCWL